MKTIVIFDFDGTIADSLHLFIGAINRIAESSGYNKIRDGDVEMLRGKKPRHILRHLRISPLRLPFVLKRVRREVNAGIALARPAVPMREMLVDLKRNGCRIGILTSNTERNVREFLINNNLDVFDFLYSGSSVFGKGRVLGSIIRGNGVGTDRIFYVGDEIRDIDAARGAGVTMIAVTWGFNTAKALRTEGPDHMADSPDDIAGIVLGRKRQGAGG